MAEKTVSLHLSDCFSDEDIKSLILPSLLKEISVLLPSQDDSLYLKEWHGRNGLFAAGFCHSIYLSKDKANPKALSIKVKSRPFVDMGWIFATLGVLSLFLVPFYNLLLIPLLAWPLVFIGCHADLPSSEGQCSLMLDHVVASLNTISSKV